MARIRTIKPEFWDSPHTAKASAVARLAYIAMWCWADDSGVGTMNEKELEGFIFPYDDLPTLSGGTSENFRCLAAEVSDCFEIEFYRVSKRPYYRVVNFDKHQRTERKAKGRHPGPEEADNGIITRNYLEFVGKPSNFRREAKELPTTSAAGTGEQGNRGTDIYALSPNGSSACATDAEATAAHTHKYPNDFEEFWNTYPRRRDKRKALAAFRRAKKRAPLADIMAGAERYRDDPNRIDQYTKYPEGWLNGDCWNDDPLEAQNTQTGYRSQEQVRQAMRERAAARDAAAAANGTTPTLIEGSF